MISYFCEQCNISIDQSECSICGSRAKVSSRLFWCDTCGIPTYDEICPLCHNKGAYFTTDARPVFPEERLLLEILLGNPLAFINDSVWNGSGNRYFVNGKRIKFSVAQLAKHDPERIRTDMEKYEDRNNYHSFDKMIARWISANSERYSYITTEAKRYISSNADCYINDEFNAAFVSFSGGKDSTVVSDLVRKATGNPSIIHIFGDTTLEFPQTYEYIERFRDANRKTPLLKAQNREQDFFNLCETFGPPSRALRWCCTIFKTGFIGEKIEKTFGDRKHVLSYYGIRRSESTSRSSYERSSTGKKISKQLVASPIIDWLDYDIWLYILSTQIDFNTAYRLGYTRVGCWCCPNNSQWSQFLANIYMPKQAKRFHDILYRFAVKMDKVNPEEYVTSGGWKARQGGAGIELSKNVAIDFAPCASDEKSFNYALNRPITKKLYELFKPFGILNFDMGKARLGEVYILDPHDNQPIIEYGGKVRHLGAARLYIDSKNDEGYILGAFTHREDRAPVETDLSAL